MKFDIVHNSLCSVRRKFICKTPRRPSVRLLGLIHSGVCLFLTRDKVDLSVFPWEIVEEDRLHLPRSKFGISSINGGEYLPNVSDESLACGERSIRLVTYPHKGDYCVNLTRHSRDTKSKVEWSITLSIYPNFKYIVFDEGDMISVRRFSQLL